MKQKVGIITMHGVWNYGSALQAYATCYAIRRLGFDAEIINYKFPNEYHATLQRVKREEPMPSIWQLRLNGLCSKLIGVSLEKRLERLRYFFEQYVPLSREEYATREQLAEEAPEYDIYVTGSDQVWNPRWIGEDTSYLLEWVPDNKKKIAYAASFGIRELPTSICESYRRLLKRYDHISVREESSILDDLLGERGKVTLDPTFLLNKREWSELISEQPLVKGDYILCYLLRYTYDPFPYAEQVIRYVKKTTGMKVVMIGPEATYILNGYKVLPNCGPLDFLNLFYNASYVITSSFHGTSFAINFRKDFITIIDDNDAGDNRQVSLVKKLGLGSECVVRKNSSLADRPLPRIDYSLKAPAIDSAVADSLKYLADALKS